MAALGVASLLSAANLSFAAYRPLIPRANFQSQLGSLSANRQRESYTPLPLAFTAAALIAAAKRTRRSAKELDVEKIRADFPALNQEVKPGVPLVYLDNAATSQKPKQVLAELNRFYSQDNSNVHRGMHALSIRSTEAVEAARAKVSAFVNAEGPEEIIFTRNATEAINLVARTWGSANLGPEDEILLSVMEHHSNLVPWQQLAQTSGAKLKFAHIRPNGTLDTDEWESLLTSNTKLVALCHVSNVLGCVNPIKWAAERAHSVGAKMLVDACQSVPHMPVDVRELGADWLVASSHKMCGPTGIGFLWGRADVLRSSPPFLGGGEMIDEVKLESALITISHTSLKQAPQPLLKQLL